MNSGGSEQNGYAPQGRQPLNIPTQHLSLTSSGQEKILSVGRLLLSIFLAIIALLFMVQNSHIHDKLTKQRLLEVSLQDLVIQSTALRHLSQLQTYQTKLNLESQGYGSAQEVVNQLAARLAIIETIRETEELTEHTQTLRQHLVTIDAAINPPRGSLSTAVEQWFVSLGTLNAAVVTHTQSSSHQINELHQLNLILGLLTLCLSVGTGLKMFWRKSDLRSSINKRLVQISCESRTDPLTGLLNAKGWQYLCDLHLKATSQQGLFAGSIAVINIDHFKQFCDTYGTRAGEIRLCELAETLKANFRPTDRIGRIGEHEFAVLLPNCTSDDAERIIERMRKSRENTVEFSAGICDIEQSQSTERTMAMADQAMYQARRKDNKNH